MTSLKRESTIKTIRLQPSQFAALEGDTTCDDCGNDERLGFLFSYAYQPIVDTATRQIFAHEALVRGPAGESAYSVLAQVNEDNRYRFDQACRVKAIKTAAALNMQGMLSINFMPNAIYQPERCIRTTLAAADTHGFPIQRIIFETVEGELIEDAKWLAEVLRAYQAIGFLTAIDDFGAGFAGLNLRPISSPTSSSSTWRWCAASTPADRARPSCDRWRAWAKNLAYRFLPKGWRRSTSSWRYKPWAFG